MIQKLFYQMPERLVQARQDRQTKARIHFFVAFIQFLDAPSHLYKRWSKERQPFNFHGVFCTFYDIFNSNEIPVVYQGALGLVKQCWDI